MMNIFDRLISRLHLAEERISEPENKYLNRNLQNWKENRKKIGKTKQTIQELWNNQLQEV